MAKGDYLFSFPSAADMAEVEETLLMSVIAAEAIHGRARVRLEARFTASSESRTCTINADAQVGQDVARIFTEFLNLQVGEDAFTVSQALEAAS